MRVVFKKGEQRKFLQLIKTKLNLLSLRSIKQFGIETNYSTIKNYYLEYRLIPKSLLEDLCKLARISPHDIKVRYLDDNFGQIKGGKKGIKTLNKKYRDKIASWRIKGGKSHKIKE